MIRSMRVPPDMRRISRVLMLTVAWIARALPPTSAGTIISGEAESCVAAVHPHGLGTNGLISPGDEKKSPGEISMGPTSHRWLPMDGLSVHPHVHGDNRRSFRPRRRARPSPPRVQGENGSYPADVETPQEQSPMQRLHTREEKNRHVAATDGDGGSPPQAWGQ